MLSVCMIVKDEINVFERCIKSAKAFLGELVTEIIVVDTGSTDGTRELAINLGCKVYDFDWVDDFSKARNYAIDKAENSWVMVLDADEFVVEVNVDVISDFIKNSASDVLGEVFIKSYGDSTGESYSIDQIARVFCKEKVRYINSIHEIPELIDGVAEKFELLPINIDHTGYTKEVIDEKDKTNRNIKLILKSLEKQKDMYLTMHLGKSYMELGEYEKALEYLEKVVYNEDCVKYTYYVEAVQEYEKCFINLGWYEKGLVCEKFWDRCSYDEGYVYFLGHIYFKNGYFEKAMDCFMDVINREEVKINKINAVYSLAQLFEVLGFYPESIQYYNMCGEYSNAQEKVVELGRLV